MRRLIDKWLKAGVVEQGQVFYPETGTPQGGVVSPTLSNIFLHHVVDVWFAREVQPRLRGSSTLIRYCDDFVMLFACIDGAEWVHEVLGKRWRRWPAADPGLSRYHFVCKAETLGERVLAARGGGHCARGGRSKQRGKNRAP